jgi:hypothetical protein
VWEIHNILDWHKERIFVICYCDSTKTEKTNHNQQNSEVPQARYWQSHLRISGARICRIKNKKNLKGSAWGRCLWKNSRSAYPGFKRGFVICRPLWKILAPQKSFLVKFYHLGFVENKSQAYFCIIGAQIFPIRA